jgi:hypothetical protein
MKKILIVLLISTISCGYKWLSSVTGYSKSDSNNGYAGIIGKQIVGVKLNKHKFRVHLKGKSSWESETKAGGTGGDLKTPIDGIAISGGVKYAVYANRWLPEVQKYDTKDATNGYAGILGVPITALMVKGDNYAVAISDSQGGGGGDFPSCYNNKNQKFVRTGTGLQNVSYQRNLQGMREGCLFMTACVIGGLGNDNQIMMARSWSVKNGYIRDSDTYVNMGTNDLAKKISQHFGTVYQSSFSAKKGCGHFWTVDSKGREVFNSAGLGYSGC